MDGSKFIDLAQITWFALVSQFIVITHVNKYTYTTLYDTGLHLLTISLVTWYRMHMHICVIWVKCSHVGVFTHDAREYLLYPWVPPNWVIAPHPSQDLLALVLCGYPGGVVGLRDTIISSCFPLVIWKVISIAARINGSQVRNHHWLFRYQYIQFIIWKFPRNAWKYIHVLITGSGSALCSAPRH